MAIEATNELYNACIGTIEKACKDAYEKNPIIDFDDYRSYADEVFMDAVLSYNPASGTKFNTWLTIQLLRLKKYASRGGAMIVDHKETPDSIVGSLDMQNCTLDGKSCCLHDKHQTFNDTYQDAIAAPSWDFDWWKRMENLKPYMGELSEDARTMVDDILDGHCGKFDKQGNPLPEYGQRNYIKLTPRQLYRRLYIKRGWQFERVRDARIEVENMLRKWAPCKLPEMEEELRVCNMTVRTFRGSDIVAKTTVKWDRVHCKTEGAIPEAVEEIKVQDELF